MLDIHLIRKDQESLANAIAVRGDRPDFSKVLELDEKRRQHIASSESMRQELNAASKAIGLKKRNGEDASAEMEATHNIKAKIAVEEMDAKAKKKAAKKTAAKKTAKKSSPAKKKATAKRSRKK